MPPTSLTDLQCAEIAAEFDRGVLRAELATRYGVSCTTISKALRRLGTPARCGRKRLLDTDQEQAVATAYARGESLRSIAKAFGVSAQHVCRIAASRGIPRRRPNHPGRRRLVSPVEVKLSLSSEYESGSSLRLLAGARGVSHTTVMRALERNGIPRRPAASSAVPR